MREVRPRYDPARARAPRTDDSQQTGRGLLALQDQVQNSGAALGPTKVHREEGPGLTVNGKVPANGETKKWKKRAPNRSTDQLDLTARGTQRLLTFAPTLCMNRLQVSPVGEGQPPPAKARPHRAGRLPGKEHVRGQASYGGGVGRMGWRS